MKKSIFFSTLFVLGLMGCGKNEAPPSAQFNAVLTIPQLMNWVLDPAADGIWDAVGWISTEKGERAIIPRSDAEWNALRNSAATLMEASNLLMLQGRAIDDREWMILSRNLSKSAEKTLAAVQARDPNAVFAAGSEIDTACEACHIKYAKFNEKDQLKK